MKSEKFFAQLDVARRERILEAVCYFTTPDTRILQDIYDSTLDALVRCELPKFENPENAAYAFYGLFESKMINEWIDWANGELKIKTDGDVFLTEISLEDAKKISGNTLKGQKAYSQLTRKSDNTKKLIVVGPYINPIEMYSIPVIS